MSEAVCGILHSFHIATGILRFTNLTIPPAEAAAARHAVPAPRLLLPLQLRGPHHALPGRGRRERETGEQIYFFKTCNNISIQQIIRRGVFEETLATACGCG